MRRERLAGRAAAAIGLVVLSMAGGAWGSALATFNGSDAGSGSGGVRTNADAAAAAFGSAAAARAGKLFAPNRFEGLTLGSVSGLTIGPGATLTAAGNAGGGVANATTSFHSDGTAIEGYNTTAGGSEFYQVVGTDSDPVTVTFSFAVPIDAFGAYLTGVGTVASSVSFDFDDGTPRVLPVTGSAAGGVQFFGFTDVGAAVKSVTFDVENAAGTRDIIGIDDVQVATPVPEPASAGHTAVAGVAALARRRLVGAAGRRDARR